MKGLFVRNVSTPRATRSHDWFVFGRKNGERLFAVRPRPFFRPNFRPDRLEFEIFAREPRSLRDRRFGTSRVSVRAGTPQTCHISWYQPSLPQSVPRERVYV
ncbi:hypothetical protein TNCV_3909161 [Trichonephila clavipes]|nr:hypothetical protein TNCV_3909161 [Trichonephila clavipes]